ncbi:MAG: DUF86 domain-containing protein [Microthrixaceae bacterium]
MSDDRRRLTDILAAVADAGLIVERGRTAFDADPLAVRAAKNIVSEIGEATKALSLATTDSIADVPWRAIAGMRDRTIHRDPEVDLEVLWDTLEFDLPEVADQIRKHLAGTTD